jgi:bifunctional non-homologous end joining protein LigD
VRLYSRNGAEYTDRLPRMAGWFANLAARAAVLDGELCFLDAGGGANFHQLMAEMRRGSPDELPLMFFAFDLLHQDGVSLQGLALSERKRDLHRLVSKSGVPFLREVQTFPDGALLLDHCNKFRFEGVVSKRLASKYLSGQSRNWVKAKCPDWKRANVNRGELFER